MMLLMKSQRMISSNLQLGIRSSLRMKRITTIYFRIEKKNINKHIKKKYEQ